MILAAGFGTRMMPFTQDRPKPLIEVAGKALLDHALDAAKGCDPIAVNAHYKADQIAAHLDGRGVHVLHEPRLLDSGGGVRNALGVLGPGPLVTLNSDAVWAGPSPVEVLCRTWDPKRMDGLMLLIPQARATGNRDGRKLGLLSDGRLLPDAPQGAVYTGVQILGRDVVGRGPEGAFSMWEIWNKALAEDRLFGCIYPGAWADVGHPAGIALAEDVLNAV